MPRGQLCGVLRHLHQATGQTAKECWSDAQLLERYVAARDEEAFALLVERYGRLVYSVCRPILRQEQDLEDAFQATFLVLASRAASIRRTTSVASWLYGVAYRTAMNARRARLRRREESRTPRACAREQPATEAALRELQAILTEEVQRLPEKHRAPFVLCCLEGRSRAEAAAQLGLKEGTVSSRLAQARTRLQQRLAGRGIVLAAALCVVEVGRATALTSVPPALVSRTARVALAFAAGRAADFLPGDVVALAREGLRGVGATTVRITAVLLLAVGLAAGAGLLTWQLVAGNATVQAVSGVSGQASPRTDLYGDPLPEGAVARMGSVQWRQVGLSDFRFVEGEKKVVTVGTDKTVRIWDRASGKSTRAVTLESAPESLLTLSPDGTTLAGRARGKLVLWATDTGKETRTLDAAEAGLSQLTFSPDGRLLAITKGNGTIRLWDWQHGKERDLPGAGRDGLDSTCHVVFSPDSRLLAVVVWWMDPLRIHDTATGREVARFDCRAMRSAFSPDGKQLIVLTQKTAAGKSQNEVRVLVLADGREVAAFPVAPGVFFHLLVLSPDGKRLACGDYLQTYLLDLPAGKVRQRLPSFDHAAFTADGKVLAGSRGAALRFFDTATGKELSDRPSSFAGMYEGNNQVALSPDGRELASLNERELAVYFWDTASGRLLRRLRLADKEHGSVSGLALAPDGRTLLVARGNGTVGFWDVAAAKELRTVVLRDPVPHEAGGELGYRLLALSPDGKQLSTVEFQNGREYYRCRRLTIWDGDTGKLLEDSPLPFKHQLCSWPADGSVLAVPTDDGLELRRGSSGRTFGRIVSPSRGGIVAASADQRLVAVLETLEPGRPYGRAVREGKVGIRETSSGKEVARLDVGPVAHLALANGGRCLVTTDDRFIHIWDVISGNERRRWALPSGPIDAWGTGIVSELLALPNGRRVVTLLFDGTALVWDLSPALDSPEPLARNADATTLAGWWADLASDDAGRAYTAVWRFAEIPKQAVPFLREHLRPAPEPDRKHIRRLIGELDSDRFETRENAEKELERLGGDVLPALHQALQENPSAETRRRVKGLLTRSREAPLPAETLRALRALHALEQMNSSEARELVRALAEGNSQSPLTSQARATLRRLGASSPGQP